MCGVSMRLICNALKILNPQHKPLTRTIMKKQLLAFTMLLISMCTALQNRAKAQGAPTGMTSSAITTTSAVISWIHVSNAISYNVNYRKTGAITWTSVNVTVPGYHVSGLTPGSIYEWRLQSVFAGGPSP